MILSEQAPLKEVPIGDDSTQHEPVEKGVYLLYQGVYALQLLHTVQLASRLGLAGNSFRRCTTDVHSDLGPKISEKQGPKIASCLMLLLCIAMLILKDW